MLKPAEKEDLNQISLTGMRALVIVCLLVEAPRSLQEIRDEFLRLNILDEDSSNDILRIDLNTLRYMGWKISRATAKTNYKYVLLKQPFCLNLADDEIALLRKIYKRLRESNDINLLIKYDKLFQKIANKICDNDSKEKLLGLSIFKHFNTEMVKDLIIDAEYKNIVELEYSNPARKSKSKKQVSVQRIVFKNDKLVGWATKEESIGISMLLGNISTVYFNIPYYNEYAVTVSNDYKIDYDVSKDKIIVNVNAEGSLKEISCNINLEDKNEINKLEKKVEEEMKKYMEDAIELAKNYQTDIFGFGNLIYKKYPKFYNEIEDWNTYFTNFNIEINTSFKYTSRGTLDQSLKQEIYE